MVLEAQGRFCLRVCLIASVFSMKREAGHQLRMRRARQIWVSEERRKEVKSLSQRGKAIMEMQGNVVKFDGLAVMASNK